MCVVQDFVRTPLSLKARDPMQWEGLMNNLKSCAREIMNEE